VQHVGRLVAALHQFGIGVVYRLGGPLAAEDKAQRLGLRVACRAALEQCQRVGWHRPVGQRGLLKSENIGEVAVTGHALQNMNYSAKLLYKTMIGMKHAVIGLAIAVFLEFLLRVTSMHPASI
jgi:hypothetical protein